MAIYISTDDHQSLIFIQEPPIRTDRHKLAGIVTIGGAPVVRRIMVFDRYGEFTYIASCMSKPDGSWTIENIPEYDENSLIVIALDDKGQAANAEVFDFVSQVTA